MKGSEVVVDSEYTAKFCGKRETVTVLSKREGTFRGRTEFVCRVNSTGAEWVFTAAGLHPIQQSPQRSA